MKTTLLLIALFFSQLLSAQDANIYLEAGGASSLAGVSYDARFSEDTKWGYRIGLSFVYSHYDGYFPKNSDVTKGITMPLEINYLVGKRKHYLELAFGLNVGQYYSKRVDKNVTVESDATGYFFYTNIGYRLHPDNGMVIRVGLNPAFRSNDKEHGVHRAALIYPYISVGIQL